MRAYQVTALHGSEVLATRYGSTQADARTKREELCDKFGVKKASVTIQEVEIELAKPALLSFINDLSSAADGVKA